MASLKISTYLGKTLPVEHLVSSFSTPWGRKRVSVQLLDVLSVTKFHAQYSCYYLRGIYVQWSWWSLYFETTHGTKTVYSLILQVVLK